MMRARRGYVVTAGQLLPLFLEGKAHAAPPPHSAEDHRVLVSNQKGIRGTERTHTHTQTNDSSRLNMNASTRAPRVPAGDVVARCSDGGATCVETRRGCRGEDLSFCCEFEMWT